MNSAPMIGSEAPGSAAVARSNDLDRLDSVDPVMSFAGIAVPAFRRPA